MKKIICFFIILFSAFLSFAQESTENIPSIPAFAKNDRILILAPHPDDETIGVAGIIQRALEAGADVYVSCYTNGDGNEIAFIMYEKRLTFFKGEFIHMGEVRRKETVSALKFLGVDEDKIFFLGYPDVGTLQIMLKYWQTNKPYRSLLTRTKNVPYQGNLSPNAPYVGESILKDIKTILIKTRPTKIFVSHPADTNTDHQSLYLFLRIALWELADKIKNPQVYPYLAHCVGWPRPVGFHPKLSLSPPQGFIGKGLLWQKLNLTEEELKIKSKALGFYKTQIPYKPHYLSTFARRNELFGDYSVLGLKESPKDAIDWQNSYGSEDNVVSLYYAKKDGKLYIKLSLTRKITKGVPTHIYLLPYRKNTNFSNMPKIRLVLTRNKLLVYNKRDRVFVNEAKMSIVDNDSMVVQIPLVTLNSPDLILSRARIYTEAPLSDISAWRILKIE